MAASQPGQMFKHPEFWNQTLQKYVQCVPVSCKKGTDDVLALLKVLLFVLNKEETVVNGVIQAKNRIIESGHFDIFILLQDMSDSRQSDELKLQEFAFHQAHSSPNDQLNLLINAHRLRSTLIMDFNSTNRTSVNNTNPWLAKPPLTRNVFRHLRGRTFLPYGLNDLVICIRNCHQHLDKIGKNIRNEFGAAEERYIYYWLVKFPGLVSSVYKEIRPHKNHIDLQQFFTIDR